MRLRKALGLADDAQDNVILSELTKDNAVGRAISRAAGSAEYEVRKHIAVLEGMARTLKGVNNGV